MSKAANDVVISGIGIVTCQGVGKDAHIALLSATSTPKAIVETEKFKPYPVHPLPEIDWSQQIAKRGDQRQMENWQRIGVFAAGLALDDAGFKDDIEACGTMDMLGRASAEEHGNAQPVWGRGHAEIRRQQHSHRLCLQHRCCCCAAEAAALLHSLQHRKFANPRRQHAGAGIDEHLDRLAIDRDIGFEMAVQ